MNVSLILLAGGQSSRMKYNKEYLQVGDRFLVHKQIETLSPLFDDIVVVSPNQDHYNGLAVRVVEDILPGRSPIIGLHAGLVHARHEYAFVVACDMPFVDLAYIEYLTSIVTDKDAYVVERNRFVEPFQAIYHKRLIPLIETLVERGEFGFQNMIKKTDHVLIGEEQIAPFLANADLFKNINSEAELFDIEQGRTKEYRMMPIEKVRGAVSYAITDKVITEYPLSILVNGEYYVTMMTTPTNLEFFVLGYLYNESIIHDLADVTDLVIDLEGHTASVTTAKEAVFHNQAKVRILSSACGGKGIPEDIDVSEYVQTDTHVFSASVVLDQVASFNKASSLFQETGGVHSVFLSCADHDLLMEDIGRHNAVDKISGYVLKNRLLEKPKYVVTSGRISSDILLKCARANISLVVSRSAPTTLAVHLAQQLNLTVVGFARGNGFNVYTHPFRIRKEDAR